MAKLTRAEVFDLLSRHGYTGALADCIASGFKAESGWDTEAVGDNGHSIGLGQLHDQGAGAGLSVEERQDPDVQVRVLGPVYEREYNRWAAAGFTGVELAWRVCCWAERPFDYTNPNSNAAIGYRTAYRAVVAEGAAQHGTSGYVFPIAGPCTFINGHWDSNGDSQADLAVDLFADAGTPIAAVTSGTATVRNYRDGGHTVLLEGDDAKVYYYAHMEQDSGVSGRVVAGQYLGRVGNTGNARSTPSHCHWAMATAKHGIDNYGQGDLEPWAFLRQLQAQQSGEEEDLGRVAELEAQVAALDSRLGYLRNDVAAAFEAAIDDLESTPRLPGHAKDAIEAGLRPALNTLKNGPPDNPFDAPVEVSALSNSSDPMAPFEVGGGTAVAVAEAPAETATEEADEAE